MPINSFKTANTEKIFNRQTVKGIPISVQKIALRKLVMLHAATNLNDLRIPPGNHLEKLTADREGQYSIRVNEQFRICFLWSNNAAYEVEITKHYD